MRNVRFITSIRDSYTRSFASASFIDRDTGQEFVDGSQFQPIRDFYPRDVVEQNCFRPAVGDEEATHRFDSTITPETDPIYNSVGIRYTTEGITPTDPATHVNDWVFPMFPDFALYRRERVTDTGEDSETEDAFDAEEEVLGVSRFEGREGTFEEELRLVLLDDTHNESGVFYGWYNDILQRVGWFVYPPLDNLQMVNGNPEFFYDQATGLFTPLYARFISPIEFQPENPTYSEIEVSALLEVSKIPYGTPTAFSLERGRVAGPVQFVYPGGFDGG